MTHVRHKKVNKHVFSTEPKARPDMLTGLLSIDEEGSPLESPAAWHSSGEFMRQVCAFYHCSDATLFYVAKRMALLNTSLPDRFGIRPHATLQDFHLNAIRVEHARLADEANAQSDKLIARNRLRAPATQPTGGNMTVSIYRSTANGAQDVIVQTNATELDVFMPALAEAMTRAVNAMAPEEVSAFLRATIKHAMPLAFRIAGYKADTVVESRMLTSGHAAPESTELLAQSTV